LQGVASSSPRRLSGSPCSAPFTPELLLHVRTNEGPVRSVVWAPAALDDGGDTLAGRSVFMTAGHDGNVSIWDARCGCCSLLIWQW
jgi:WD40 repeat protein